MPIGAITSGKFFFVKRDPTNIGITFYQPVLISAEISMEVKLLFRNARDISRINTLSSYRYTYTVLPIEPIEATVK